MIKMEFFLIIKSIEEFSSNLLNIILSLESPVTSIFQNFWGKLVEWGFVILSTIIGAIVAIKIERKFQSKQKLYGWKLVKETFNETIGITASIFLWGLLVGIGILIAISLIRKGMEYSSTITLIVVILLLIIWNWKKKKKNAELTSRFKKDK